MSDKEKMELPLVTMDGGDYQDLVSVACYALEHGFSVSYRGQGILLVSKEPHPPGGRPSAE